MQTHLLKKSQIIFNNSAITPIQLELVLKIQKKTSNSISHWRF